MIKKLLPLIFLFAASFSQAQVAPFAGGDGDGYDMAVWEGSTGVMVSFTNQFKVTPQPFKSGGWVRLEGSSPIQQANISLIDIAGKSLFTRTWKPGKSYSFKLPELAAGFYVIHIQTAEKLAVKKVQIVTE